MRKHLVVALISLALVALSALVASAQPLAIATDAPPKVRRNELRIGMLIGRGDVGDVDERGFGLHVSLGRRYGELTLMAEYERIAVGDADNVFDPELMPRLGAQSRVGGAVRYSLLGLGRDFIVGGDFWVEAGGGYQRTTWDGGGELSRPDAMLGFGVELDGKPGLASGRPHHTGMYLGLRALLARGPRVGGEPTCGGPCDRATLPSRNDTSVFLHLGWHFGR